MLEENCPLPLDKRERDQDSFLEHIIWGQIVTAEPYKLSCSRQLSMTDITEAVWEFEMDHQAFPEGLTAEEPKQEEAMKDTD